MGCRKRALAVDLVRLSTVSDRPGVNAVTVDTAGNLPGRGAWLHPHPQCLDLALRRRAIGRALRISGSPDTTVVEELFHRLENR
ncbi:YlxR family protein [Mycolicibacterium neoaurum]|uniref:YlxR family protein n=1 Tax=Mycolicibacterium neoaurum TaxID=1795 RepID=UPI002FFD37EB